jgi:phospholipid transport system substrate-binding protein
VKFSPLILVLALTCSSPGFAAEPPTADERPAADSVSPLDVVRAAVDRMLAAAPPAPPSVTESRQQRAEMRRAVQGLFDFTDMTSRALAQHWKRLDPAEQQEFTRLFTDVVTQSFVTIVETHSGGPVAFLGEAVESAYARVHTTMARGAGPRAAVEYRLVHRASRWVVYDVVCDSLSLVSHYRNQMNTIIQTTRSAELMERLRTQQAGSSPSGGGRESADVRAFTAPVPARLAVGLLISAALATRPR